MLCSHEMLGPRPERLARLRRAQGLSLRALAAAAGVSVATVNRIERGLARPHPKTAKAIADVLDRRTTDVVELNGDDDEPRGG